MLLAYASESLTLFVSSVYLIQLNFDLATILFYLLLDKSYLIQLK